MQGEKFMNLNQSTFVEMNYSTFNYEMCMKSDCNDCSFSTVCLDFAKQEGYE